MRLQSDTMFSGLQFSSLIRAGFGICLELRAFLGSYVRSRSSLLAENLFLRKQLAFYQEHQVRPRRLTDAARISLVLWSKFCDWRSALVIVKPETLIGWHRRLFKLFWKMKSRPGRPKLPSNIRQTRNSDRLASPAFQAVLEDEITPGQTEATQQHPSTDCSNGGRKSDVGARSEERRVDRK